MSNALYNKRIMRVEEGQLRDFLLDAGLVSRSQIDTALKGARGKTLSEALIESGILGEEEVRRASAHALGIPYVVLEQDHIDPSALRLIPESLCRMHGVIAFRESDRGVEVALLNMADLPAIGFLEERARVLPRLTSRESLRQALLLYQNNLKEKFGADLGRSSGGDGALEALLLHAVGQNASAVHLEPRDSPNSGDFRIRYRVRGVLREAMSLSKKIGDQIVAHIKKLGSFSESNFPQDARFKIDINGELVVVRAGVVKTVGGGRMILNIMPERVGRRGFTLESLGLHGEGLECVSEALQQKSGLIIVSGPQGSGTTTTLYTILDLLNHPTLSLASVEEFVEYRLPHVAQTQAHKGLGLSTSAALRGVLKQDPDVVAVGDVKDEDTALLAVQAAQNKLMILEVKANSATEAVERLLSLGVPENIFSNVISVVTSQRLVRRLCGEYKEEYKPSREELSMFEGKADFGKVLTTLKDEGAVPKNISWKDVSFYRSEACGGCEGGYLPARGNRGRFSLFEVMGKNLEQNGLNIAEDGLFKAASGETSIKEVLSALN